MEYKNFALMAKKAVNGGTLPGFKPLQQTDVEIFMILNHHDFLRLHIVAVDQT